MLHTIIYLMKKKLRSSFNVVKEKLFPMKKYGYVPSKDKTGTFYLLIEPDPHKPWTYKGWLETVIKTGRVLKTVELPTGFIIQKRIEVY